MVGKWTNEPCGEVDEVVNHFWVLTGIIKITTFFVCIFDISPHVFTQISIEIARWMRN